MHCEWEACYEIAFSDGRLSVTRKLDFARPDGAAAGPYQSILGPLKLLAIP
jgi:hypothetical protein